MKQSENCTSFPKQPKVDGRNHIHFVVSDAVILGASSVKHLEENLKSTKHEPLHEGKYKEKIQKGSFVLNNIFSEVMVCFGAQS